MVRISLVLPTLDRPLAVYNLLRHLEHQSVAPHEILVIDQSEREDPRVAEFAASRPHVRVHRIAERGLPNARNVGVRLAEGDVVLFLDDDSVPEPDLVRYHAEAYGDPEVAGVGGRVTGGYDRFGGGVGRFRRSDGVVVRNFDSDLAADVDHLPGGNMSFRRAVFDRVGGFDVAYGGSSLGEETDFCLRARRAGFRLVFEPRAALEHLHLPTGGCRERRFETWLYWHAHNSILFVLRHAGRGALPGFLLKRIVRFTLFSVEHGSPVYLLTGLKGLLRGATAYVSGRPATP